jgi:predicted RNase H-like HicB family nuclease
MSIERLDNKAITQFEDWRDQKDWTQAYRCHVCLIPEEQGGYSAIVLNLPGAGSCGDSEEEALTNVREAIEATIESYLEAGEEIPWQDSSRDDIPEGAKQTWILVNA